MKSKAQKQQEAIERKRRRYVSHVIPHWCESQRGGERYKHWEQTWSTAKADEMAQEATKQRNAFAKEAHVDIYGNPLEVT